jgi:hypothetical protein
MFDNIKSLFNNYKEHKKLEKLIKEMIIMDNDRSKLDDIIETLGSIKTADLAEQVKTLNEKLVTQNDVILELQTHIGTILKYMKSAKT